MKEGLRSAEEEVKGAANARRREQVEAARTAKTAKKYLLPGTCDTCGTALKEDGRCATCRRDAKRLDGYRKQLLRFQKAEHKVKELGYAVKAQPIKRATERMATMPNRPDQNNEGFGIKAAAEVQKSYFSFTCTRYGREREKGWSQGPPKAPVCHICVHVNDGTPMSSSVATSVTAAVSTSPGNGGRALSRVP